VRNAATLVVRGNSSLTITIAMSGTVTEYSAVVKDTVNLLNKF